MSRTPFVCNGHDGLTHDELRKHQTRPCKDDATRDAANKHAREAYEARKANPATSENTDPAPVSEYVDHFRAPAAAFDETADTTPELGSVVAGLYPRIPKPVPPVNSLSRPSGGATRRLRGLTNLGYTPKELAFRTGLSADSIWWLLIAPPTTIKTATHTEIDRAYKALRLELKTAPADSAEGRNTSRAHALAELHDWAGPFAYENIDDAQDQPRPQSSKRDATLLAQAIAEAALDDIVTPTQPETPVPVVVDTTELAELRATNDRLTKENMRQCSTISTLQADARTSRHDYNNLLELKDALINDLNELKAANVNLHEQLAEAKFANPTGPAGITGTVELDTRLDGPADAFTIEYEPTPAGGFTLTLPSALLVR
ncbi:MAG: hypothetical protein JWN41_1739 [Thermoleophilia bacterium]|nr:hypothetical protein [Thermoleophilia bacterium]